MVSVRWTLLLLFLVVAGPARAAPLVGDLDGDGSVGPADSALLEPLYGQQAGGASFDPAADWSGDGAIDQRDLAIFGASFGASGPADTSPPTVFITLNDIPDDQNDLLVVPPDGFQITIGLDSAGGSLIDLSTLSVTSDQDLGGLAAGSELASIFQATPTRLFYEVPAGMGLARTSHFLTVQVRDLAGNLASSSYGFAVRDFGLGAPFATTQTVFLDFDQDRSLGAEVDFLEDLRTFGLASTADPALEATMRDLAVTEILTRSRSLYGQQADGSPGADPVNVVFTATLPAGAHAHLCIGGQSTLGGAYLGASPLDPENLVANEDTCTNPQLGVFPSAIDDLWGADPGYLAVFSPLVPALGGTPVGEDPLDAAVLDPSFPTANSTLGEFLRFLEIQAALQTFGSIVGSVAAHETGHLLGLVAHGAPPAGLYGGASGANTDHNVTAAGATPTQNWVMNAGTSFSFDEITGGNGQPLPTFRPLSQAYLHDRIALNQQVTGLYPAPTLVQVIPNPALYPAGQSTTSLQIDGTGFFGTPFVDLRLVGGPTWKAIQSVALVSSTTITGSINAFVIVPGSYDVRVTNPDGQAVTLLNHLVVQQQ